MTRSELRTFTQKKLKAMGYQAQKSYLYKIIDDDYLIGFHLYPSSYIKGYSFVCGIIYLPDELKMPLRGVFDLEWEFQFPFDPDGVFDLKDYPDRTKYMRVFEYEKYTLEQLEVLWDANFRFFMEPLTDKNYGLEIIRKDWNNLKRFAPENVLKLCLRANMDINKVFSFLGLDIGAALVERSND